MTEEELQEIADTYGLYTEQDVKNRVSCELLSIGTRNEELEKENEELKERVKTLTIHDTNAVLNGLEMKVLKDSHRDRANKTQEQLTKAKKLIEKLLIVSCNSEILIQYPNCKEVLEARVALEQFLMEK